MKILLVLPESLDDIILATPVIRVLKSQLECELHGMVNDDQAFLVEENPYLDQVHRPGKSPKNNRQKLKAERFQNVVDLRNTIQSWWLTAWLGANRFPVKKFRLLQWLLVRFKINRLPKKSVAERNLEALSSLGVKMDSLGVDYFIPEKDEVENDWLPKTHQAGFAIVALDSDYQTRKLPTNRLIELCDRINKPIVLIGKMEESEAADSIEAFFQPGSEQEEAEIEALNKKAVIFNACGKFSVNQMASLIAKSNWVFCYDSFLMHVAAAFKKPIFSIWGNTVPEFGRYPFRTQFSIFENKNLKCRPCSSGGFQKCPKGHFKCMNEVTFDFYLPD